MEIRVIDFEILTRHYIKYQDGLNEINELKNTFIKKHTIELKRSSRSSDLKRIDSLVGKKIKKKIFKNQVISKKDIMA